MKKIITLLISASFLTAAPLMAFENPTRTETDQYTSEGPDEFDVMIDNTDYFSQGEDPDAVVRSCPRGYDRKPIYHYDRKTRRWVVIGYRCRRHPMPHPTPQPTPKPSPTPMPTPKPTPRY